ADVISVQLIGLVILLTMRSGSLLLIDGMLVLALLSFAGTIAAAQFIARPHVMADIEAEAAHQEAEALLHGDNDGGDADLMTSVHGPAHKEDD
ncbi:MAG: MrpF/PhaF family protein, partial [Planctomycetota bacterium]